MKSGKVSQTMSNIYEGKRNEETPLLYEEESFKPFSDNRHSSWKKINIVSAEAKVDEGATRPNQPVQMDKTFLPAIVLQLYSSKPLLLVVASLALVFGMYNIVVHDTIVPFATAIFIILLCGIRYIMIERNERHKKLLEALSALHSPNVFPIHLMAGTRAGAGAGINSGIAAGIAAGINLGHHVKTSPEPITQGTVGCITVHGVVDLDPDLHNISEAEIQDIKVSKDIYIPYQGGDTKNYSSGFNEYTEHVRSLSQEYKGLRKEEKKNFVKNRIINYFHNKGHTFFSWDKNKKKYVPFDLDKEEDLVILTNKVMQKIRDIKDVEMQDQPDPSSAPQSMGNENVVSICDPSVDVATLPFIQARRDTPINSSLSTATAATATDAVTDAVTATSNHLAPSSPKKRKIGREEHHVQEDRTLFHESYQDILATPNSIAKCDLSGVAIKMTPKEVEESDDIFIINSYKRNINNSKGFDEYTTLVGKLSQNYKNLPPNPRTRKREFVQEKIINHFHDKGCRFFIPEEREDHYVPFNLDKEKELKILTDKVMQKIRDIKSA